MKKDYYSIIGVAKNATDEEIKNAYRKLAKEKHPDRFKDESEKAGAETEFKEITEAYSVLSDNVKRREYDNPQIRGQNIGGFNFHFGSAAGGPQFEFMFEQPLEVSCSISIDEALSGVRKKITYDRIDRCGTCNGTGGGNERISAVCRACRGGGYESLGFVKMTCRHCSGSGRMSTTGCGNCGASGTVKNVTTMEINMPKGCAPSTAIRMVGAGNYSKNRGGYGEMYIRISISPPAHGMYNISFPHIVVSIPISYKTAVLGGKVRTLSPHGKIDVTIPKGTPHGRNLRIPGKGMMTAPNSGIYGDLVVCIEIDIPEVTDDGEDIIKSLDDISIIHKRIAQYESRLSEFDG